MENNFNASSDIGIVIIGRNEGDRLFLCIKSLINQSSQLVYVDSDSTDDSVDMARRLGVEVVSLDMKIPFTAARARNEGFERMRKLYPKIGFVQFVDGDCEIVAGWLESAANFLTEHQEVAVVCGRRRERFPEQTVYNMLCDIEWDTPVGEAKSCGGDALMRVSAFEYVRGYRSNLIAGEEPELCVRLRAAGWKIWRLGEEMTLHDAGITRFEQWWKRARRAGYAFAEGAHMYGSLPERHGVRQSRSARIWGMWVPMVTFCLTIWLGLWGLAMLLVYPIQIIRLFLLGTRTAHENLWRAIFLVLGKFPEVMGQLNFFYNKLAGKTAHLIEYK